LDNSDVKRSLVQKGALVESAKNSYAFASPVVQNFFFRLIFGDSTENSQVKPNDLEDLILRIMTTMNYSNLKESLAKTESSGILLERAWQMEFYRTAVQCVTFDMHISADVGSLFDVNGAIDFTVHSKDMSLFWGIELLREADRIDGHIERFQPSGRYQNLCRRFTDSCLVDFRRQSADNNVAADLAKCASLFIVTYDNDFSSVLFYSKAFPEGKKINARSAKKTGTLARLLHQLKMF
jgi:hypothetical protein